ncbi:MAG: aminopeptidase P family N-terminal domain-containing protein [Oscillospiraceae bacterium]|nr:aminopeptidase P family N-terminal domain-containing protein [Oscillospiraceae bacterium]
MLAQPTKQELSDRINKLYATINKQDNNWDFAFITDKINQYYFTGTMQDGVFVLRNDGEFIFSGGNRICKKASAFWGNSMK